MIPLNFEKYAVPLLQSGEAKAACDLFVADQLVEAMLDLAPRIDAFEDVYKADVAAGMPELLASIFDKRTEKVDVRVIIPAPHLSWKDSVAFTSATIHALHSQFGRQFDQMIERSWGEFTHTNVPGMCGGNWEHKSWKKNYKGEQIAGITLQTDGTINDPIYLTHEAGHYTALVTRGDHALKNDSPMSMVVNETQAFFFQFAGYNERCGPTPRTDIAEALDQHRRAEMLSCVTYSKFLIGRLQDHCIDTHLTNSEQYSKDQYIHAKTAHTYPHGYGALLGAALYSRYRTMSLADKDRLLDVLYPRFEDFPENDGQPPLAAVLAAVGVETAPQLLALFHEGADLALSPPARSSPRVTVLSKPTLQSALRLSV